MRPLPGAKLALERLKHTLMKAILVESPGSDSRLVWSEVPDPVYGPDEVLVDVHATALNRADLLQRAGHYPPPPGASSILGLEMAGRIVAVGKAVPNWRIGDRVCALLPGGGYATRAAVPYSLLMPIPDDWSYTYAAAIPEVFYTAYLNLFIEAGVQAGETVLIHGGASGVGTAAIQLACAAGCRVFATAGTDAKTAYCESLGAEQAINYRITDFYDAIQAATDKAGVDVILDMVGADYLDRNVRLLKPQGRLVVIAFLSGARGTLHLGRLLSKRLRLIGSTLRNRPLAEKIALKEQFMAQCWDAFLAGTLRPIIDSTYPITEIEAAHARMRQNLNIGKIGITCLGV